MSRDPNRITSHFVIDTPNHITVNHNHIARALVRGGQNKGWPQNRDANHKSHHITSHLVIDRSHTVM